MTYSIFITNRAQIDIDAILNYMQNVLMSKQAADNFLNNFSLACSRIADFPYSFAAFNNSNELRKNIIGNYAIIYKIDNAESVVHILRVVYAQRDFYKLEI